VTGSTNHARAARSLEGNLLRLAAELPEQRVHVFSLTHSASQISGTAEADARLLHLLWSSSKFPSPLTVSSKFLLPSSSDCWFDMVIVLHAACWIALNNSCLLTFMYSRSNKHFLMES